MPPAKLSVYGAFEVETKMIWNYLEGVLAEGEGYANGHTRS